MSGKLMSSNGRTHERVAQKLRTREALLTAARELAAQGKPPTVARAADAATVSRATAYRYFPTQEALLVEIPIDIAAPTVQSLFDDDRAPHDPEDRAALVQNALYDLAREHETEFRLFLRNTLLRALEDPDSTGEPFRGARRSALLDSALAPLETELPASEIKRLKTGLSILVGIESMIVLRDVLRLSHDEARAAGESAVRELVRAARERYRHSATSRATPRR
jgi:AcrR family transcriptional regulator